MRWSPNASSHELRRLQNASVDLVATEVAAFMACSMEVATLPKVLFPSQTSVDPAVKRLQKKGFRGRELVQESLFELQRLIVERAEAARAQQFQREDCASMFSAARPRSAEQGRPITGGSYWDQPTTAGRDVLRGGLCRRVLQASQLVAS